MSADNSLDFPKKVSVMGLEYNIQLLPDAKMRDDDGSVEFSTRTIRIRATLPPKLMASTLLHEIIHVVLHSSGLSEIQDSVPNLNEAVTLALEHGLHPLVDLKCLKKA